MANEKGRLPGALPFSRRDILKGIAISGALASLGMSSRSAWAQARSSQPTMLTGTDFALSIGNAPMSITGALRPTTTVNGSLPAPILRWREGTTVTLRVANQLPVTTSIHWHGILLPAGMDGVPGFSFPGIAPGETFTYRFPVKQSGTYWYHSHSGFQEQTGLYGAIIIDPAKPDPIQADRDYVVMLSDWTDEDPERVFTKLKQMSDYYNYQQPTAGDFLRDVHTLGFAKAWEKRRMWNQMRMNPTDLLDVSGATLTYLVNGATPADNWTGIVRAGERVRLRLINGSASSFFDVRIPGLKMTVVSTDGQAVEPVTVDEIRIGTAETYDVIVQPQDDRAYTIFAQSMDRSGYARATLAPREGMQGEVPALDPKTWLSMSDMGMDSMGGMSGMAGMGDMKDMPGMAGMDMSHMAGMDMSSMKGMDMSSHNPAQDMVAMSPSTALDDPGPRLRDNGRKVLTYSQLHTIGGPLDQREPTREITLHLTGNMRRFIWGFDGKKFSEAEPIRLKYGERVRITLVNDTMMAHPIHLHGMFSELETPDGEFQVRKHTIVVQPGKQLSYLVTADALGRWAYHCHLLYHMEAGMFREVVVA